MRNPVIQKAEDRGYKKGFAAGEERGRGQAIAFIIDWFEKLDSVPGIGTRTTERISNEFLKKYGKEKKAVIECKSPSQILDNNG